MAHGPSLGGQTHEHTEADISDLTHTDPEAIHDNVAGEINAITAKTTLVDADLMLIEDSEASYAKKKVQVVNMSAEGDIKYSSGDMATGTSYSTTEATLATKSLTVSAGDVIRVHIWGFSEDATTDDTAIYADLGNAFSAISPATTNNWTADIAFHTITWFLVVSTSLAHRIIWQGYNPNTMNSFPNRGQVTESPVWTWEDITTDVTGTQDCTLHVKDATGTGTLKWYAQIRQYGEVGQ